MTKFTSNKLNQANEDIISAFLTKYDTVEETRFTLSNQVVIDSYIAYAKSIAERNKDVIAIKFISLLENLEDNLVEKHAEVDENNL